MKREAIAQLIISEAKAMHERDLNRAANTAPAVEDPQVKQMREFLKGKPFGAKTKEARKYAELLIGKSIPFERNPSKGMGRLKLGIITQDTTGHHIAVGTPVLSLTREGNVVWFATETDARNEGYTIGQLINPGKTVSRAEVRAMTAAEAEPFLAALSGKLFDLGELLTGYEIGDLCQLHEVNQSLQPVAPVEPVSPLFSPAQA